jgi:beta-xylosidase
MNRREFISAALGSRAFTERRAAGSTPIIFADVPDMAMIRVGDVYYMSSTTMHMSP